jgi:hypothetical protein
VDLSTDLLKLLPSDDDVQRYREDGYYLSKRIFSEAEIDAAVEGSERFYGGQLDGCDLPAICDYMDKYGPKGDYGRGMRKHDYASFVCRPLAALVRKPILGAIAARLQGVPVIRLWHDQLLLKPPDSGGAAPVVGWHTDRQYWKCCTSEQMLTAWIPFHDCDAAMGTISFVPNSHQWPDNSDHLDFWGQDLENLEKRIATGGRKVSKVPANLKKGQVSFHHCLTIHGSGPNRSRAPRRSIAVHLQDGDNRYQDAAYPDGRRFQHYNMVLARECSGVPDFADPDAFPTLFDGRGAVQ